MFLAHVSFWKMLNCSTNMAAFLDNSKFIKLNNIVMPSVSIDFVNSLENKLKNIKSLTGMV